MLSPVTSTTTRGFKVEAPEIVQADSKLPLSAEDVELIVHDDGRAVPYRRAGCSTSGFAALAS